MADVRLDVAVGPPVSARLKRPCDEVLARQVNVVPEGDRRGIPYSHPHLPVVLDVPQLSEHESLRVSGWQATRAGADERKGHVLYS